MVGKYELLECFQKSQLTVIKFNLNLQMVPDRQFWDLDRIVFKGDTFFPGQFLDKFWIKGQKTVR